MISFVVVCSLSGAAGSQQPPVKPQGPPAEKKILIVYLSRTNNTKAVADIIHEKIGGKLVALELQTPYPANYPLGEDWKEMDSFLPSKMPGQKKSARK
jgi:hypothetical protein